MYQRSCASSAESVRPGEPRVRFTLAHFRAPADPSDVLRICIPVHNEATTIGVLLWRLRSVFQGFSREYDVVVYDDASTDGTSDVLEPYQSVMPLTVLRGTTHRGYAASIDALVRHVAADDEYARRDAMVLLQGDFTESPEHLPELVKRFEGGADLVAVHRTVSDATPRDERRLRRWGRWAVKPFLRLPPVADPFTGFRLVRISVLRDLLKVLGNKPVCAGDGWAANIDFALNVSPFARRIENVEFAPRYDVRQRPSRRRGWPDVVALFHWARSTRGTIRPAPGGRASSETPIRGESLVVAPTTDRPSRTGPPERNDRSERGRREERGRPPRDAAEPAARGAGAPPRDARPPREERVAQEERPAREERAPREGRNAREERALRGEERAPRPDRPPREPRTPRPDRAVRSQPVTPDDSLDVESEVVQTDAVQDELVMPRIVDAAASTEAESDVSIPAKKARRRRRRSRRGAKNADGSAVEDTVGTDAAPHEAGIDDFDAGTSDDGEGEQDEGGIERGVTGSGEPESESSGDAARRKRRSRRRRRGRRSGGPDASGPDGSPSPAAEPPAA